MSRLALALSLTVAIFPTTCFAQSSTTLHWEVAPGAEDCATTDALVAAVTRRLEREVFSPDGSVVIDGRVEPAPPGFSVTLVLRAEGRVVGERSLRSRRRSCAALNDSLVLMLALLVEVGEQTIAVTLPAETEENVPPPSPAETPVALPLPPPPAAIVPEEPPASSRWPRLVMSVGARGAVDVVPGPSVGARAAVEVGAPVAVRAAGGYYAPVNVEAGPGREAQISLAWGQLGVCAGALAVAWLELGGCGSVSVGAILGRGMGFDENLAASLPWIALDLEARARALVAGPLALSVGLGLEVPLATERFTVASDVDARVVYATPPVAPHLDLAIELWTGE